VTLEETIIELTTRTPSGGGFWIGNHHFTVRYCADCWEWEYGGNVFYDLQDLAEEILRRGGARTRPAGRERRASPEMTGTGLLSVTTTSTELRTIAGSSCIVCGCSSLQVARVS